MSEKLGEHATDITPAARRKLLDSLHYRSVDAGDPTMVASLFTGSTDPVVAYLALPPNLFPPTVRAIDRVGLPAGSRVVLEKPFGDDLDGAVSLNRLLAEFAAHMGDTGERAVYRVDHVLGMATMQNLRGLRQTPVLDAVWNRSQVQEVEILWEETLALEGRAGYYDSAGALKDVLQNHMLQILCLVAMEPPGDPIPVDLPDRRLEVLRSARLLGSRRARYAAGRLADSGEASGTSVPGYAEEKGVDPGRRTETFVEIGLELTTERWREVPFFLRAGKALSRRRK
ncbi:MAG TPA: glucose-6-phosphate dehydrogenase, partial [Chloroflexota bacterium]|nr:glucose-6-phosphate dehydrogenase [Chloroflexota bacterium]